MDGNVGDAAVGADGGAGGDAFYIPEGMGDVGEVGEVEEVGDGDGVFCVPDEVEEVPTEAAEPQITNRRRGS